jgi:hypothetical protein
VVAPDPPDYADEVDDEDAMPVANLVRPYALTKGRTEPRVELPVEATIEVVDADRVADDLGRTIVDHCAAERFSVAEIAAELGQPLGVTRVLLADLVAAGAVSVRATLTDRASDRQRQDLIERTLRGLRAL